MSTRMYSPAEVAGILGLHVRTVRGYVRDGRLKAVRLGKQYRISEPDLLEFTGALGESHALISPAVTVTAVVQIEGVARRVMDRITTHAVAVGMTGSTGKPRVDVHTVYDEPRDSLRVVVVGDADDTASMIALIDAIAKDDRT